MGSVNISDGLNFTIPSKGTLNSFDQLLAAFRAISAHDHTTGKGKPITGAAIAAGTITADKIADETLTGDQIAENSIPSSKIIGGTGGDAAVVPTGTIAMTLNTTAPSTWALLTGQIVTQSSPYATLFGTAGWHDKWAANWGQGNEGAGNWRLPDFTRRMPIGNDGAIGNLGTVGGTWLHTHKTKAHYHGMGTGADLAIASGGAHTTALDHDHASFNSGAESAHTHFITTPVINVTAGVSTANTSGSGLNTGHSLTTLAAGRNDSPSGVNQSDFPGLLASPVGFTSGTGSAHVHPIDVPAFTGNSSSSGAHAHASGDFSGHIGLVTGGVDGNADQDSGTANPPYIIVNFVVKL